MLGVVFESACSNLLGELRSARSVIEAEFGSFCGEADDLVDPIGGCSHLALSGYDQGAEEMEELSVARGLVLEVLGRMGIATNAVLEEACSAILDHLVAEQSSHDAEYRVLDLCTDELVYPVFGCSALDLSGCSDRCDDYMDELRSLEKRVHSVLSGMYDAVCAVLPADRDRRCPRMVFLEASPEWTGVPHSISQRAQAIRRSPPEHLADLDFCDLDHYDVVLNEILARPTFLGEYLSILMEVQDVCGDRVDLVSETLGISLDWVALKRAIVARVLGRRGSFALLDVIGEIRNSMPAVHDED